MQNKNILLSKYRLSSHLELKNRIVMAPMTRRHALPDYTPSEDMIGYYARRADAGLIITEGTLISADAIGYGNVPGIFTLLENKLQPKRYDPSMLSNLY